MSSDVIKFIKNGKKIFLKINSTYKNDEVKTTICCRLYYLSCLSCAAAN